MSDACEPLDSLPAAILADVLASVADAGDLAAYQLASRALLSASYHCPRVRLCAAARASRLREGGPPSERHSAPSRSTRPRGQGCPDKPTWVEEGDLDEADDLHLTCGESMAAWAATAAGSSLREVEIADFWPRSCWRKTKALPVISNFCHNLIKLGLGNAWLSVDGLKIMPNLTHLTLEFIRLDDEGLSKLNECFPCLQILNLVGVGGLKEPKIHLPQLETCRREVSNGPRSLAIHAPNLVYLELKCVRPEILILDTPTLCTLKLIIDKLGPTVQVDGLVSLTNLRIESLDLSSLLQLFTGDRDIRTLDLELPVSANHLDLYEAVKPDYLLQLFARITEVKLSPRFSCELMRFSVFCMNSQFRSCLKKFLVHLPPLTNSVYPFKPLIKNCAPLWR